MSKEIVSARAITVADLKDHKGCGPHPFLYCEFCGAEWSANKGDYFTHPLDYVFTCCDENMRLVRKVVTYEDVKL